MKTIQLFASNKQVELKKFSGGECHVRFLEPFFENDQVSIHTRLNSSDDVMTLCLAVDALRHYGVQYIEAFIPYLPYARQDRVMVSGEPLSVKVFARIINSLKLNRVTVFDAHSDVSVALLDNCCNVSNHDMVNTFIKSMGLTDYVLVSPDLGAYKKVDKLAHKINYRNNIATGIKIRDLVSGQIIKSDVMCGVLDGRACVIVDDICDGGRTFIELAKALRSKGAGLLYLCVSHGIFSHNALECLLEAGFTHVLSTNSICNRTETEFYKQYNLFES